MSRTYKDKPSKFNKDPWNKDRVMVKLETTCLDYYTGEEIDYTAYRYMENPTTKPKKRKELDTEDHWMTTPSWWWRLMHHRPTRRAVHIWEKSVHRYLDEDIDLSICPDHGNKPHQYFW